MNSIEVVTTFNSTHHALKFEKTLKENEVKLTVMPVPREISASCGLAVKFDKENLEQVRALADSNEIMVKGYYEIQIADGKRGYLVLD